MNAKEFAQSCGFPVAEFDTTSDRNLTDQFINIVTSDWLLDSRDFISKTEMLESAIYYWIMEQAPSVAINGHASFRVNRRGDLLIQYRCLSYSDLVQLVEVSNQKMAGQMTDNRVQGFYKKSSFKQGDTAEVCFPRGCVSDLIKALRTSHWVVEQLGPLEEVQATIPVTPNQFKCPISLDVMEDPVVAADGHTYERAQILQWMSSRENPISPMTGAPLDHQNLTSNHTLRSIITDFQQQESVRLGL